MSSRNQRKRTNASLRLSGQAFTDPQTQILNRNNHNQYLRGEHGEGSKLCKRDRARMGRK